MNKPTMMIINDPQLPKYSFKLISIDKDGPYMEGNFFGHSKQLRIITKDKYMGFQMVDKLDAGGVIEMDKRTSKPKQERKIIENCHDFWVIDREDIVKLIRFLCADERLDLTSYFTVDPIPKPDQKAPDVIEPGVTFEKEADKALKPTLKKV